MPFRSEAQRRLMFAKHPQIAKRWTAEFPGQKNLPYHAKDGPMNPQILALLAQRRGVATKQPPQNAAGLRRALLHRRRKGRAHGKPDVPTPGDTLDVSKGRY